MKKFTKGLVVGIGTGIVSGIGTSLIMLAIIESNSRMIKRDLDDMLKSMEKIKDDEEAKEFCSDTAIDIAYLGETSIIKTFENINNAINLKTRTKTKLKGFLNEDIK